MIFASDLDRTLIYSKKFIDDKIKVERDLKLVEKKEDIEISYMTKNAIKMLHEINENILFIPVTTRTIEQYKRIFLFQEEIVSKYAIVSNGGNILENGIINNEWNDWVKKELARNCSNYIDVKKKFNAFCYGDWILREYIADNLFYYFIIDPDKMPYEKLYDFEIWLKENKWTMSMQGRKLYLIPDCVDKWKAINYICEKESINNVVSSGDSLLDLKMLNKAKFAISPNHGEIKNRVVDSGKDQVSINFTRNSGFLAAEDILIEVKKYINKSLKKI